MAVALDTVGPSSAGASSLGVTTLSWTHTTAAGAAVVATAAVGIANDAGVSAVVALDPAGANTNVPSLGPLVHSGAGTAGFAQLFGLPNVAAAAHTLKITASGGTPVSLEGGSVSYTGADLTAPFSAVQSNQPNTGNPSIAFTGSTAGNIVCAGTAHGNNVTSVTAGTSRWIKNADTTTAAGCGAMADVAGGGTVTITWSTISDWSATIAVEVKAATAGARAPAPLVVPQAAVMQAANW